MKRKQISVGVLLSYISIAIRLISGVIYTPIVLTKLGQSQYGVYSLCLSCVGYLTILNAGVNAAYIRFYVQQKTIDESKVDSLNAFFFKAFIILSIVGFAGGMILSAFSPQVFGNKITIEEYELVKRCLSILAVSIGIEIFTCVFKSFIIANEEFIFGKTMDILAAVLAPVLTVPLLYKGYDCSAIIFIRLVVAVLCLICDVFFCEKKLKIVFSFAKNLDVDWRAIIRFTSLIFLQSILDQLNWQIDKFILARTHGTTEVSIYSVGANLNSYYVTIGAAVAGIFIAEINRLEAKNDDNGLDTLYRKTAKLFTYLLGFVITAYFIFGRQFVERWAGSAYVKSYTIGWLLMTPVTWVLITRLGLDIGRAKNKHKVQIINSLAVSIINVIVSIPLAIHWGAVGSAVGTFAAEIIICIILNPLYHSKILKLNVANVFKDFVQYLPGLVIPVMSGIVLNHFNLIKSDYRSIILYGLIYAAIYALSVWVISMNSNDRTMLLNIFRKNKR